MPERCTSRRRLLSPSQISSHSFRSRRTSLSVRTHRIRYSLKILQSKNEKSSVRPRSLLSYPPVWRFDSSVLPDSATGFAEFKTEITKSLIRSDCTSSCCTKPAGISRHDSHRQILPERLQDKDIRNLLEDQNLTPQPDSSGAMHITSFPREKTGQ
jgi:hypothetical protein